MLSSRTRSWRLGLLLALSGTIAHAQQDAQTTPASATTALPAVELTERAYTDPSRRSWRVPGPRPLQTVIWYPAPAGADESRWRFQIFDAGTAAREAAMVAAPTR